MKLRNVLKKYGPRVVVVGSAVVASGAHAALDAAVTTQITTAQADITTAGSAIIVMAAVAMGLRWVKATFF